MDNLKQYAALKQQIKELESQLEELKPFIMDEIQSRGKTSFSTDYGTFAIIEKRSYEYPPKIVGMEAELKAAKKEYEGSPDAVLKNVIAYPAFYDKKEKND